MVGKYLQVRVPKDLRLDLDKDYVPKGSVGIVTSHRNLPGDPGLSYIVQFPGRNWGVMVYACDVEIIGRADHK